MAAREVNHGHRNDQVQRRWNPRSWRVRGIITLALVCAVALTLGMQVPVPGTLGGIGRPDELTTGVPPAVALRASGALTVTRDGTVLDGLDIQGCVTVKADRVRIRRSRIRCDGWNVVQVDDGHRGTVIEDVDIDGRGSTRGVGVAGSDLVVRRANIHDVGDGIRIGSNSVYEDNYIHDLSVGDGSHNDGMQATGETRHVVIHGNRIEHPREQTSAVLLKADFGPISDVRIEANWLNGGNYTLYVFSTDRHVTSDVSVRLNRFGRDYVFGPLALDGAQGFVWRDNVWDDTGEPMPQPVTDRPPPAPPSLLDELQELLGRLVRSVTGRLGP